MIIRDAHSHYGLDNFFRSFENALMLYSNKTYGRLTQDWKEHKIEKCILFPQPMPTTNIRHLADMLFSPIGYGVYLITTSLFEDIPDYSVLNQEIYNLSKADTRIEFVPMINSRLKPSELEKYPHIRGVKYYAGLPPEELLKYLDENGLNLIIHLPEQEKEISSFLKQVSRFDGVKFQVAHCAYGSAEVINAIDELDNLFIDTSACSMWIYKKFVEKELSFDDVVSNHPGKTLFGSDEPYADYKSQIDQILQLEALSGKDKENVLAKNYSLLW